MADSQEEKSLVEADAKDRGKFASFLDVDGQFGELW